MTKKAMIEKMQMIEAASWLKFKETEVTFGKGNPVSNRKRSEWFTQCDMLFQLGIDTNHQLPDNQKALEIILEQSREELMVKELEQEDFDKRDVNS
jgi:hypothetical protein